MYVLYKFSINKLQIYLSGANQSSFPVIVSVSTQPHFQTKRSDIALKAAGVVVEYNPFHNGHAFHLARTKEITGADIVIAVMSGQFLQRGEPALVPKWLRAEMALRTGADIVIELPYQFSTQNADTFAFGAVSILNALGCKYLCFGSESGNTDLFNKTLQFLQSNREEFEKSIRDHIAVGISFPAAAASAFKKLKGNKTLLDLSQPNNILGLAYLKAIEKLQSPMLGMTIKRTAAHYHDQQFTAPSVASATSIRKALFSEHGNIEKIKPYVPDATYHLLKEYKNHYRTFHSWENYWPYLKFRLLQLTPEELAEIYEIEEGIENRLLRMALSAPSFQDFMMNLKTKRYTWTRLQRMCVHILTNTKKHEMHARMHTVSYMRLLGMTKRGRKYLNEQKENFSIPLVSKLSSYKKEAINLDLRAARIYAAGAEKEFVQELLNMEFSRLPIYLEEV